QEPDSGTGAGAPPLYRDSTYRREALGRPKGYKYARVSRPARNRWEHNWAGRQRGGAFHDEVSEWVQRWVGRLGSVHASRAGREVGVSAKGGRSYLVAVRVLADSARRKDVG